MVKKKILVTPDIPEEHELPFTLDYVISGFAASFRLGSPYEDFEKEVARHLKLSNDFMDTQVGHKSITLSGLFNGFTEESFARKVNNVKEDFKNLYSGGMYVDSGGLQVLTQGKVIDKAMRTKIYDTQSTFGHYAMSFDVIPAKMVDGQRIYLPNEVQSSGIQAGKNLGEQIDFFDSKGTDTKIVPIVQGMGESDMELYTSSMFSQISKAQYGKVDSLAFGAAGSGFALVDRIVKAARLESTGQKMQHTHLLGVTGFKRLLPCLLVAKNGFIKNLKKLSFDSTTFSKSYILGSVFINLDEMKRGDDNFSYSLGKVVNDKVIKHYDEMFEWWKANPNNIFESAEDMMEHSLYNKDKLTTGFQQYEAKGLEHGVKTIVQKHVWVYYNTFKFMNILDAYLKDEIDIPNLMGGNFKNNALAKALETIVSDEDYDEWFQEVTKSTKLVIPTVDAGNPANLLF